MPDGASFDCAPDEARIDAWLADLSLQEKAALLAGRDFWHTRGVERAGIAPMKMSDGPVGVRGAMVSGGPRSACFPCGTALAASWNPALVERVGEALGDEARSKGAHVLLAPTVNIHRSPLAGRNFECFSEDPFLCARMAVAYVRGVQRRGVAACVKHFVCNDSEYERHSASSDVGARALREIYLPPFEAAVREAGVVSLMGAYNRVNGTFACEHPELLQSILRDEWGFEGFVVSDWGATKSAAAALRAGLDLEMPGPGRFFGEALVDALEAGEIEEALLDRALRRLLRVALRTGSQDAEAPAPERADDRPEHRALAREAAREAIVLLRNEGGVLPFDAASIRSLAVVGPCAARLAILGGGSAQVTPHYSVSVLEGLRERCAEAIELSHALGCMNHRSLPEPLPGQLVAAPDFAEPGMLAEYFDGCELAGEPVLCEQTRQTLFEWMGPFAPEVDPQRFSLRLRGRFLPEEDGLHSFGLISAGKSRLFVAGELVIDNWTQQERGEAFFGVGSKEVSAEVALRAGEPIDLAIEYSNEGSAFLGGLRIGALPPCPDDMLERAVALAARSDAAVVVLGLGPDWETEGRDRESLALPGRQVELARRVAAANPRTAVVLNAGAPVDLEWLEDVPAALQLWYPGQEGGRALADVLFGDADPGGRLPQSVPRRIEDTPSFLNYPGEHGHVLYGEGLFVGYRYYDTKRIAPRLPFGHGLSYTRFELGEPALSAYEIAAGEGVGVALDVHNAGERRGSEVVQVYLRDVEASVARPEKELAGFHKLELEPGESRRVQIELTPRAFAFWDPSVGERGDWHVEPGEFEILIGRSSREILHRVRLCVAEET